MTNWQEYVRKNLPELRVTAAREAEIVQELAQQLEQSYREARSAGAGDMQAEEIARAQFPNWKALAREINAAEPHSQPTSPARTRLLSGILRDFIHAARLLRNNPVFASVAIITLAFGIGANSAIFTSVDAIALRPLPYPNPERLVAIESREAHQPEVAPWTSAPDFFDLRDHSQSYTSMAAISPVWNVTVTGNGDAERLETLYVSAELFPMLGVKPAMGRGFLASEDNRMVAGNVAVLSYAYWQRKFGGNSSTIGQSMNLDGAAYTVIGVMPRDFHYLGDPVAGTASEIELWLPLAANQLLGGAGKVRAVRFLKVVGQLKPYVSLARAQEEIHRLGTSFAKEYPDSDAGLEFSVESLTERVVGKIRPMTRLLLGAVGLVLLMACANVANLMLTMASTRHKEFAVRAALGASRFRLARQLLAESLLLAFCGGAAGILVAYGALRALVALAPANLLQGRLISLDARAFSFCAGIALLSAILSGLPQVWRVMRVEIEGGLRESGRGFTSGHHRFRAGLVVAQIALALALLIGAGLLIRSFARLLDVNPGFDASRVVTLSTQLPSTVKTVAQALTFDRQILERVRNAPGVRSVGEVSRLPLLGSNLGSTLWIEGRTFRPDENPGVEYRVASPDYFATMGIPLREGRYFGDQDDSNAAGVAVINESAARKYWRGVDPIGQHIKLGPNPAKQNWITVVGVVGDIRHFGLDAEARPEVYRPINYSALVSPIIVARADGDPAGLLPSLAGIVRSVDPTMPVYNLFSMEALVERSVAQRRFLMSLLTGFAVAALFLAAIGIYGSISQSVAQRTKEMGLRMALGAMPGDVLRMVLAQGVRLGLLGIAIGGIGAAALSRLMQGVLFEVSPLDLSVYMVAAGVLGCVAMAACLVPALRATRVDPLIALRHE